MNERLTETFTRNLIQKTYFPEEIYVYEQISDNLLIQKILDNKKPDFIIDFKNNHDDIIIIIECKANTKNQNQALKSAEEKYAQKLKKNFNVFYYGITGQNEQRSLIEGCLWIKNHQRPFPTKYNKLLKYQNIKQLINKLIYNQNYFLVDSLKITKIFNNKLHQMAIPESERPIIIGCFLIALLGDVTICDDNESLKNNIINAVNNKLKNMDFEKKESICAYYNRLLSSHIWIANETVNSYGIKQKNINLKFFLEELKQNIMPFINEQKYDIMGTFYREFIKYATEDKKTGLVLTPPHITDFFCELVNIQSTDIVLDPCCGTGGFLISAMKYMINKTKNEKQIQQIKSEQLYGIEQRPDMWLHASVNMMMHGDGHTNIWQGNCFSYDIKDFKIKKPNVVFLNPPYHEASEQLRFIQKALELVVPKGQVIAIVQASVTSQSPTINHVKKEILKNHTLLASFSCPKDLFHGIAGVITNILIFEAHVPHNHHKATFLGWMKDDGFIKQKQKRIDKNWDEIKNKWLDIYRHQKEIKNEIMESKLQMLTAEDEWCIEAHLQPDLPSKKDFMLTIKKYLLYEMEVLLDDEINRIKNLNQTLSPYSLFTNTYKSFSYQDIFDIVRGKDIKDNKGKIPYISATSKNNGVSGYTEYASFSGNRITLSNNGSIGEAFYQKQPFAASQDVYVLTLKNKTLNPSLALFLCTLMKQQKYYFHYGRKWRQELMSKMNLILPHKNNQPCWEQIEQLLIKIPFSKYLKKNFNYFF